MSPFPAFFLVNPVTRSFRISDPFDAPRNYTFAPTKKQSHEGVDIVAVDAQGNAVAVLAAQRGTVDKVGFSAQGYGNYVRVVHEWGDDKYVTWYGHLSSVTAQEGQFVQAGQKLGIAGTTGFSTGIHLHLTLQHIGKGLKNYTVDDVVNPAPFFDQAPAVPYDEVSFIADVTVPDGMVLKAGERFTKVWRIRNTGTTTWDAGYRLAFSGQSKLGGPDDVPLPVVPVQPGQNIDVPVDLVAPSSAGKHRSVWQLRNPRGELVPNKLFVEIEIKETRPFDLAAYVADVTIPDGTVLKAGESFIKTWRVKNDGTTTWTTAYSLRFVEDEQMGGPASVPLPRQVKPGELVELSVTLKAPSTSGRHRSTWMLCNAQGKAFAHDQYAEIQIAQQAVPVGRLNEMQWVADVTVPDETPIKAGEKFVKTWRVRNSGETTWGPGYVLAFFGDDKMGGPDSVPLPNAKPGETVEVSVTLTAPDKPGLRRSTWKPRDAGGNIFEFDLFGLITVLEKEQVARQLNEMNWVADVTIPDGTQVTPGQGFVKTWRVRNTGTTTWGQGYTLAFFGDDRMGGADSIPLPNARPGDMVDISLTLKAPGAGGLAKSTWKARDPLGQVFEFDLFALVDVVDPRQSFDMLIYLRGDGRLYDLEYTWAGGGRQRIQTQVEGDRFYHCKHSEWEELWADDSFVYRGTDTSPGGGECYTLTENGQYGSAWLPRQMRLGVPFRRTPQVSFRRKNDGMVVPNKTFSHVTWIQLEAVHKKFKLSSGINVADVAVLAAYEDAGGRPKTQAFERYYYAKKYGLVAWEGEPGHSAMVAEVAAGSAPNNTREALSWISTIRGF